MNRKMSSIIVATFFIAFVIFTFEAPLQLIQRVNAQSQQPIVFATQGPCFGSNFELESYGVSTFGLFPANTNTPFTILRDGIVEASGFSGGDGGILSSPI